jgi:two-component system, OmpR family, copper resistance phosphate regulon response regulator CusR
MSARLLLVEDETRIADFLVRGLGEEGYSVKHVPDGTQAWRQLQRGGWDLLLLDWRLPDEDGIQLLRRFRQIDRQTPVLVLTARDTISDRVLGLDAGADDYLCKPFAFAELLARIRSLLRRRDSTTGALFEFEDVQVDLRSQRATRGGQKLDLTAKELALLLCFLHNPRTVLSRSRLYETVWGDQYGLQSNTLEVHVKELRRKLEQYGPRILHTRRGRGYILESLPSPEA